MGFRYKALFSRSTEISAGIVQILVRTLKLLSTQKWELPNQIDKICFIRLSSFQKPKKKKEKIFPKKSPRTTRAVAVSRRHCPPPAFDKFKSRNGFPIPHPSDRLFPSFLLLSSPKTLEIERPMAAGGGADGDGLPPGL